MFNIGHELVNYHQHLWPYPDLHNSMNKELPDIILDSGLYYANGMEFIASCTEMQTISAKNIVNLIRQREGKNWKINN